MPVLYQIARADLTRILRAYSYDDSTRRLQLLDVGARKSHYTIGLPADVTLMDVPRESEVQEQLHLGASPEVLAISKRRSNVLNYLLQDITCCDLPDDSFDVITAIEVIEHVEADKAFVEATHRLLRPGGILYLTTPNGVAVRNTNPDHVRHYTRQELRALLQSCFGEVQVDFVGRRSRYRRWGLRSWSPRDPFGTLTSMAGNVVNRFEKIRTPVEAAHLLGWAVKRI